MERDREKGTSESRAESENVPAKRRNQPDGARPRLLLLEDDEDLTQGLVYVLEREGFAVYCARTIKQARRLLGLAGERGAGGEFFDLAILDVSLPDGSSFSFCEQLRRAGQSVPVLFLTAADEETSVIRGLECGGDDYVVKPFRIGELCSRIRALLRRSGVWADALRAVPGRTETAAEPRGRDSAQEAMAARLIREHGGADASRAMCNEYKEQAGRAGLLRSGAVTIDLLANRAYRDGAPLELTAAEYRLLLLLVRNEGRVMTRAQILDALWDGAGDFVDDNTLSVYIRRLRTKVEANPSAPRRLLTVRGLGYRWQGKEA